MFIIILRPSGRTASACNKLSHLSNRFHLVFVAIVSKCLYLYFYYVNVFACIDVCSPHVCLVPVKVKTEQQIPWKQELWQQ